MDVLEVGRDRVKVAGGWTAEKVGRLKLNGRFAGYSPLSRVLELEGLIAGVNGKLALWHSLLELAPAEPRIDAAQRRAPGQRAEAPDRGAAPPPPRGRAPRSSRTSWPPAADRAAPDLEAALDDRARDRAGGRHHRRLAPDPAGAAEVAL